MTMLSPYESHTGQRSAYMEKPKDPCREQMSANRSDGSVQDLQARPTKTRPLKGSPPRLGRNVKTMARKSNRIASLDLYSRGWPWPITPQVRTCTPYGVQCSTKKQRAYVVHCSLREPLERANAHHTGCSAARSGSTCHRLNPFGSCARGCFSRGVLIKTYYCNCTC